MNKIITTFTLALIILSSLFTLSPALAVDCPSNPPATPSTAICNPSSGFFVDLTNNGQSDNSFQSLLLFGIQILLGIVGLLSVFFIILGGFQYVTSAGNEEQAESGKKTLTNAIIGLSVVILSYIIVVVVINALTGKGA